MSPVAPENKGVARLFPSAKITKGTLRRFMVDNIPFIVAHVDDVEALRKMLIERGYSDIDQIIADMGEELFARHEASKHGDFGPSS